MRDRPRTSCPTTTCVTLFDYQACCGGGGIRTPGACARRFSRPLPSTTRPLLQDAPEVVRQYRYRHSLVKYDRGTSCAGSRFGPTCVDLRPTRSPRHRGEGGEDE